jgi:RNA polymerase primary sigma factor
MRAFKIENNGLTPRGLIIDRYLNEVRDFDLLSPEEEFFLGNLSLKGNLLAREQLVLANLRFVISVAKQYRPKGSLEFQDIINEGNEGLIIAAERFDPSVGCKFISYAVAWIRQRILLSLNTVDLMVRVPLNVSTLVERIDKFSIKYYVEHGVFPSDDMIVRFIESSPSIKEAKKELSKDKKYRNISLNGRSNTKSLNVCLGDEENSTEAIEYITDDQIFAEHTSRSYDILRLLGKLSARERQIIKSYYGIDCIAISYDEIGRPLGLTAERVRQIKNKSIEKLKLLVKNKHFNEYL